MRAHPPEVWERARLLVVAEGQSYEDAAAETGVSLSALKRRGGSEGWLKQRGSSLSYAAMMRGIKANLATQIHEATANGKAVDPQAVFALTRLETSFPEHRYDAKELAPRKALAAKAEALVELVAYLRTHDTNALAALEPHIDGFAAELEARHGG
ncbi:DUF1804 family protein [Myxococcota bacterium]|nr:DUF1804 family protein [Myxococcota bacterium]